MLFFLFQAAEKSVDELTSEQSKAAAAQPSYVAPKTLDSVMKVERLKNKDAKEIEQIWKKFHMHRSAVFACMSAQYWNFFAAIKMHLPVFVYTRTPKPFLLQLYIFNCDNKGLYFLVNE